MTKKRRDALIYIYVCVCESNPVPKGTFAFFLYDFLIQCSKPGDCLTCNSGSPTKRLLQVTDRDSGRRIHVPVLK